MHIPWKRLRNPILAHPDTILKDPAVLWHNGWFYCYSNRHFRSRDMIIWEETGKIRSQPDITRHDNLWYLATNGPRVEGWDEDARLMAYRTSSDLQTWTPEQLLLPGLSEARNIDPALAWEGERCFVAFKRFQRPHIAMIRPGKRLHDTDIPYRLAWLRGGVIGSTIGHWGEQYQLIKIDGHWHLLTTGKRYDPVSVVSGWRHPYTGNHHPVLYRKRDTGNALADWRNWDKRRELVVPTENWNTAMNANGAYLCDWRAHDGYFYLFYAGSDDHTKFKRRGHGKIGVARSADLRVWATPPH